MIDHVLPGKRTVNPPLGLATLAALCPDSWEVAIIDENIEAVPENPQADLIGICGMGVQFERQKDLIKDYRARGYFVVAGGSYASLCPENYLSLADAVVAGEAEYIWKRFCRDFERGAPKALYRETGTVSLHDSPVPRYDLLKLDKYQSVSMQFSRGCPFRCEFCDIIVMFGRKPRTKSLEQVGRELDLLRSRDVHNVFFVDDNLIGNKALAKDLLRFLRDYQDKHDYRFYFGTEASLNLAQDAELLRLFREAGFVWVFIGIESPDEASLKETKKLQNTRQDILGSVKKIYANGLDIFAGFIIGFDNDTVKTFEAQQQFIMDSGIQAAMIGLITAIPKTPLYIRLKKEGRLLSQINSTDNTKLATNVLPKNMDYLEMVNGYRALHFRLFDDRHIARRIRNKIRYLTRPTYTGEMSGDFKILARFLYHGIFKWGLGRLYYFLSTLPVFRPRLLPLVIQDWILGVTMQSYVKRHFTLPKKSAP